MGGLVRPALGARTQAAGPAAGVRLRLVGPDEGARGGRARTVAVSGARPGAVRLTSRGRLVLGVLTAVLMAAVILAAVLLISHSASAGSVTRPMQLRHHVVLPGETLWGIARTEVPDADPRDVVAEIVQLNALPGVDVQVGDRLALPGTS